MIPTMPRSFNPNSEAGRRLEVVGQASCLSSFAVAVVGGFSEAFTTIDRLEACPTIQSHFNFGIRVESITPILQYSNTLLVFTQICCTRLSTN
jgi:hypothetical protein